MAPCHGLCMGCNKQKESVEGNELKGAILEGGLPFNKIYGLNVFEYANVDPRFNKEIFGVMPPPETVDPCPVTASWLTAMFGVMPENGTEIQILYVRRHTRAYIMLLLSTQLFEDKTVARVPIVVFML
ncbi:hypothetical protein PIB30_027798 [Stylosanthes scabra]|uniref:Uncharacterized protein n=1 Tax=Stylosanthes scabra TaxID=79078 RepID=A0ABU6RB73_9FABA|nr:hypothetical protein [Stylosanthes scabra]